MICRVCGETDESKFYPKNKSRCKKCILKESKKRYKDNPEYYKNAFKKFTEDKILRVRWLAAKHRAKRKNIEFNLSMEELEALLLQQNNKCYYTGIEFINNGDWTKSISIDRINSDLGYTINNIRLVCSLVNHMKRDRTEEGFLNCVKAIYEHMSQ